MMFAPLRFLIYTGTLLRRPCATVLCVCMRACVRACVCAGKVGMPAAKMDPIDEDTVIHVGSFALSFLHTPGHSPGSLVIQIKQTQTQHGDKKVVVGPVALITGDTVFPGSCGRLDLPESEPLKMWSSLQKVAALDPKLPIFPGTCVCTRIYIYARTHTCIVRVACTVH